MSRPTAPRKDWLAHYSELLGSWRKKNHADGEDALHDAVLRMLEQGMDAIKDSRAYLARSTANALVDGHRRHSILNARHLDDLHDADHPTVEDGQSTLYAGELMQAMMAALQDLPLPCQKVYLWHRMEGWTHAEIAAHMGISRSMVEKHMNRALLHLHEKLQKFSPDALGR